MRKREVWCGTAEARTYERHKSERVGKISHSVLLYLLHLLGNTSLRLDVLVSPNSAYAGGGGFIRDSNGNWVRVFSRAIETSFILLAELCALWNGLFMAKFLRIEKLIVNVNAGDIISLVSSSNSIGRLTLPLVAAGPFFKLSIRWKSSITSERLTELQILLLNMVVLVQNLLLYFLSLLLLF